MKLIIQKGESEFYKNSKTKHANKIEWTTSKTLATVFTDYRKAQNVIENHVGKSERKKCKIIVLDKTEQVAENTNDKQEKLKKCKCVNGNFDTNDIVEYLSNILNPVQTNIENKQEDARQRLSAIDLEISDILHYIEFSSVDVFSAWKIYKMLKEALCRRRKVKHEIEVIELVSNYNMTDKLSSEISKLKQRIDSKKYTPRVLNNLFE